LSIAKKLAGDERFLADLRERPALIHGALEVITETMSRYAAACLHSGGDGIFFATQVASSGLLTADETHRFAAPLHRRIAARSWGDSMRSRPFGTGPRRPCGFR